jgi:8-oxo-dGTP diphosphatase
MILFVGMKACIVHEGKVLIIREAPYDEGTETGKWDFPGGRIADGEPILEGLRREVEEECGLKIEPLDTVGMGETFPTIQGQESHIVRIYTLCRAITTEVSLGSDHDRYEWCDPRSVGEKEFVSDVRDVIAKVAAKYL